MNSLCGTHTPSTAPRNTRRRRWRHGGGGAPSTPLHHWTSYNNNNNKHHHHFSSDTGAGDEAKFSGGRHVVEQSARKLAAGVWRLHSFRNGIGGLSARRRPSDRSHFEPGMSRVNTMLSRNRSGNEHRSGTKHQLRRSRSAIFGPEEGNRHKQSKSNEADCFASRMKFLEDQVRTMSLISALQTELVQARLHVHDLEYELRSSRNRAKYLARKLGAERTSQKKKEHDKIYALIDDVKGQLSRERKKVQKMDVINCQLAKELAEARLSAARSVQKYEDERRTRMLLEEVCKELAMKIGEDKAEVEAMRMETMKILEEVEEERSMLQVSEAWREERVHMKLIDAKLALESKYSQLNKLITFLKTFMRSRSTSLDLPELRKGERAIQAVDIQDMEEFPPDPMGSGDIWSFFEELHRVEGFERETEPRYNYSLSIDISDYHPVSPENDHDADRVPRHSSDTEEDTKGHDGHNHAVNQGSVEESGRSIVTVGARRSRLRCEIEQDETANRVSAITETNGVCSISAGQLKSKKSSRAKLRTSGSSGSYKAITEEGNGRLSSGMVSSQGTYPPMGHYSYADSVNSHVTRGTKGCMEWPRGYEKNMF